MVKVAIAGGTSPTLGKAFTEAILATGKHEVVILSRHQSSEQINTKYGAPIISTDYTSHNSLRDTISIQGPIHTLISVLKPLEPNEQITLHESLLAAAQAAKVKRFIMSDWSLGPASHSKVNLLANKQDLHVLGQHHMTEAAVKGEHVVECCTIQNGGFLEYLVQGCGDLHLQAGLEDDLMLDYLDIGKRKLVVPCRAPGKPARITLTSIRDIGKFVASSLDLPIGNMTGQIGVAGWTGTYEDILNMLAQLDPPAKISPNYITADECRANAGEKGKAFLEKMASVGEFDVELFKAEMVAQMYACMCEEDHGGGLLDTSHGNSLNELCPKVETVAVQDLLQRAWGRE